MKKKLLIISGSVILILAAIMGLLFNHLGKPNGRRVLNFIKENPNKASLTFIRNGKELVQYKADRKMPLASVAKILIALEYANQAADDKIQPEQMVSLEDLNRYYIPNLDGGAQPEWEKSLKERNILKDSSVSLQEVVKGMIDFSSNANMEYLIELLGLEHINRNIAVLGLTGHEEIYPFYSFLLIPYSLMKTYGDMTENEKIAKAKKELKEMPSEKFRNLAMQEHLNLKKDVKGTYIKSAEMDKWYDEEFDKINSDRMVAATTRDYGILLSKINDSQYFSKDVRKYLEAVMEGPMEASGNKKQFLHLGYKGGSTNYILNSAIYALDKENNSIEMALFTNDLSTNEMKSLSKNMNEFLYSAMTSREFQDEMARDFKE
ncbi:serine hydrolase [Anaerocolumna jejuensis]|uniref:serine hydrolase n=1 Tax=Anaerocolumna jejuensis TaxID=259063 RepID=UPI003F7B995F